MNKMQGYQIENIATLLITGATIVGLYALGAGGHSFWALAMMLNISYVSRDYKP